MVAQASRTISPGRLWIIEASSNVNPLYCAVTVLRGGKKNARVSYRVRDVDELLAVVSGELVNGQEGHGDERCIGVDMSGGGAWGSNRATVIKETDPVSYHTGSIHFLYHTIQASVHGGFGIVRIPESPGWTINTSHTRYTYSIDINYSICY